MRTSTGRIGRRRRAVFPVLALAAAAVVLTACSATPSPLPAAPVAEPSATASPSPSPIPEAEATPVPTVDASIGNVQTLGSVQPVRLVIPELAIDMAVEPEGVDSDGAMALPVDAATAGWYRFGPGLRDPAGATVIAAHIDSWHDGVGPFSRLRELVAGSVMSVAGSDGSSVDYVVSEVRAVGKIDAPMAEVFDRTGAPRLTLVTCGGIFDSSTGHYLDNIIVTASPAPAPASTSG